MLGKMILFASVVVTGVIFSLAKTLNPANTVWQLFAQISGVLGLLFISWSYILATKNKYIERLFGGLDIAYRIHHILGGTAFILLINHPIFLIVKSLPINTLKTYLVPGTLWSYNFGIFALYAMFLLLFLTLYVDLPYYLWKKTHEFMGVVIFLAGLHGLLVPSDMSSYAPLKIWMLLWVVLAICSYIYKRFLYYLLLPKKNYKIKRVVHQDDMWIAEFEPVDSKNLIKFGPGQYAFFELENKKRKRDEHPFSVLSVDGDIITVAAKIVGDFTANILHTEPGQPITIRGPYGTFGTATKRKKKMVWIAGGIGITPFASMARAITREQEVYLYYSCRDEGPSVIMRMFEYMSKDLPNLHWIPCNSRVQGRITGAFLKSQGLVDPETSYFFCGPGRMMTSLEEQLTSLGVKRKNIIYENFAFK